MIGAMTWPRPLALLSLAAALSAQAPGPRMTRRSASQKDEWLETGDASRDGSTWRKFFEMKLARVSR